MDTKVLKLSKRQSRELLSASPEVFKEWMMSLPSIKKDKYHPIYKLAEFVMDAISASRKRNPDKTGIPELKLLLETLTCDMNLIRNAVQSSRIDETTKTRIVDLSERELEALEKGEYFADKHTFDVLVPNSFERIDDEGARSILCHCEAINKESNPFSAIETASYMAKHADLCMNMDSFSLLLHALNPNAFPFWETCFVLYNLEIDLEHEYSEFSFTDIYPFDAFHGYIANCYSIQCSLPELLTGNGTLVLTIAANALHSPYEKEAPHWAPKSIKDACLEVEGEIIRSPSYTRDMANLKTGFFNVDHLLNSIAPGDLIVVTGHSENVLKDFAIHVSLANARKGVPIEFFISSTDEREITRRMLNAICFGSMSKYDYNDATRDQLFEWASNAELLSSLPIRLCRKESKSLELLRLIAQSLGSDPRRIRKGLIVVEGYDALLDENEYTLQDDRFDLIKELKRLAKRYGIPILMLLKTDVVSKGSISELINRGKIPLDAIDKNISIELESAENDAAEFLARTEIAKYSTNEIGKAVLLYKAKANMLSEYIDEMHPLFSRKLWLETDPTDIDAFPQHAQEVIELIKQSFDGMGKMWIQAYLHIDGWFEDGISQSDAKTLFNECVKSGAVRVTIGRDLYN